MHQLDFTPPAAKHGGSWGWIEKIHTTLERWMADPVVYRWAISNPLTRWVARRRTQQLYDLMGGFVHTQVLISCVRLNVFALLRASPMTVKDLAHRVEVPAASLQRLVLSAIALGLLEHRSQGRVGLGPLGLPVATHEGVRAMVEHNHLLYLDLQDPVAFLRDAWRGDMAGYWPYAHGKESAAEVPQAQDAFSRYSALMDASQNFVVGEILSTYNFSDHQCVLDVGAGKGRFISQLAQQERHLKIQLFDLAPVLQLAQVGLKAQGLLSRASLHPGSFLSDPLPKGADLITLVRVAHDHSDAVVLQILRKAFEALPLGGTLLIAEPMAQEPGQPPLADAYFHYYLLAMGSGRLRTPTELMNLMAQSGLSHLELLPNAMPIHARVLIGRKSKCLP